MKLFSIVSLMDVSFSKGEERQEAGKHRLLGAQPAPLHTMVGAVFPVSGQILPMPCCFKPKLPSKYVRKRVNSGFNSFRGALKMN